MAGRAAAARFRVICHLLDRLQIIFAHDALDFLVRHAEAFTDDAAFVFGLIFIAFAAIDRNRFLQRFFSHDGAVHFFFRQAAEIRGDLLIRDVACFVKRHPFNHLRQRG